MKKETNVDKIMDKIKGKPRKKPAQTICALRHQEEAARKARLKLERETEKAAKAAHKKIDADAKAAHKKAVSMFGCSMKPRKTASKKVSKKQAKAGHEDHSPKKASKKS